MKWFRQGELIQKMDASFQINKVSNNFNTKRNVQTTIQRKLWVTAVMITDDALPDIKTDEVEVCKH